MCAGENSELAASDGASKVKNNRRKKEASSSKTRQESGQPVWEHEWTSPKLLDSNGNIGIRQIIRGPFQSPQLVRASPCVVRCSSSPKYADCRKTGGIRRGIPNPWTEYLALRGFCGEYDRRTVRRHLKLGCDSVRLTEVVWRDLGLSLAQGIPDPWKDCPYNTESFSQQKSTRSSPRKTRIRLEGASADPGDSQEPRKKLNHQFAERKEEKMNACLKRAAVQRQDAEGNLDEVSKVRNCKNTQTVVFNDDTATRDRRERRRESCKPRRSNCEVKIQSQKCDSLSEKTLKKRSESCVRRSRARILEENVTRPAIPVRKDEKSTSYACRVCQPAVTPTRLGKASKQQQENFWRCTRHQPGASYRLEASRICKWKKGAEESAKSLGVHTVEPEIGPWNLRNLVNARGPSGMIKRLLRGWREKDADRKQYEGSWEPSGEKPADINLVCCRCSCPYLRTVARYDEYELEDVVARSMHKKCVCTKCIKRRERRIKEKSCKNCPIYGHCLNKFSSDKIQKPLPQKKNTVDSNKPQAVNESASRDNKRDESPQIKEKSPIRAEGTRKVFHSKATFENSEELAAQEDLPEKSVSERVDGQPDQKNARFMSSDSGTYADVSDISRKTNNPVEAAAVTSSTFIQRMNDNPDQAKRNKSQGRDSRDKTRILVGSTQRGGRRKKRRFVLERPSEETCRCLDPRCNSEFKKVEGSIAEQKRVTYETSGTSLTGENNANLSIESLEVAENVEHYDKSSSNEEIEGAGNDFASTKTDRLQQLDNLLERGEGSSILEHSLTSPRTEIRSLSDVGPVRKNLLDKNKVLASEDNVRSKSGDPRASRRKRGNETARGVSNVQLFNLQNIAVTALDSKPVEDSIIIQLEGGPCIQKINAWGTNDSLNEEKNWESSAPGFSLPSTSDAKCTEARGIGNWNVGEEEEATDDSKQYEMVLPFQKDISEEIERDDIDDPEIENLETQESTKRPEKELFALNKDSNAPKCYTKFCADGKSAVARVEEKLLLKSCSDSEDCTIWEIESGRRFSSQ